MSARSEQLYGEIARLESLIEEARANGDNVANLESDLMVLKAELNEAVKLVSSGQLLKG